MLLYLFFFSSPFVSFSPFYSVSGDGAEILQLLLHLHLCDRGLSQTGGFWVPALLQRQVQRKPLLLLSLVLAVDKTLLSPVLDLIILNK